MADEHYWRSLTPPNRWIDRPTEPRPRIRNSTIIALVAIPIVLFMVASGVQAAEEEGDSPIVGVISGLVGIALLVGIILAPVWVINRIRR